MAVLLASDYGLDADALRRGLAEQACRAIDLRVWPDIGEASKIEAIVTDTPFHRKGGYAPFSALKWVCFLGHGLGDVLNDPELPDSVLVSGLSDPDIIAGVTEYVIHAVTRHHMRMVDYAEQQRRREWTLLPVPPAGSVTIAVLGLGRIGAHAAALLAAIGFNVVGWSTSAKQIAGVSTFHGDDTLPQVLASADQIVSILPETARTRGLLCRETLAQARPGTYLINVGRGSAVIEGDLIALLDEGHLSGACLDVTAVEPLGCGHPLWTHPKIIVTPHTGGAGGDAHKFDSVAQSYARVLRGDVPLHLADRNRGY